MHNVGTTYVGPMCTIVGTMWVHTCRPYVHNVGTTYVGPMCTMWVQQCRVHNVGTTYVGPMCTMWVQPRPYVGGYLCRPCAQCGYNLCRPYVHNVGTRPYVGPMCAQCGYNICRPYVHNVGTTYM